MSQCRAAPVKLRSARFRFTSVSGHGSGYGMAQFRPLETSTTPTQASPAPARRRRWEARDEGRGRGDGGRRPGAQGCKEVERGLLLDAVIISRRRQGPGLTGPSE